VGGLGADYLEGDNGLDTVDYSGSRIAVSASLTEHAGHFGDAEGDTFDTIENLTGSFNGDTLEGDGGRNVLDGGKGDDKLLGWGGDDTLKGGEGNDVLTGGEGADGLTGGAGADTFVYTASVGETGTTTETRDFITDFEHGTDKIDLHAMDATPNLPGSNDFTFIGTSAFTAAGQVRVIHEAHQHNGQIFTSTMIQLNTDLSPDIDSEIHVLGTVDLTAADFIL
jgi:Ca2+-binding RTX toxin-like protein